MKQRFKDSGHSLFAFMDLFLVHCPRCDECAVVIYRDTSTVRLARPYPADLIFAPRRLVCRRCGFTKDWAEREVTYYDTLDWYFAQPLWLQIPCCSEILWAYNERHLAFLESFVKAELREAYPNQTLASRLPEWMKLAKNREEILKCIRKLRETLPN